MKSGELALEPAPLSVSSQNAAVGHALDAGVAPAPAGHQDRLMPVGRSADKPITEAQLFHALGGGGLASVAQVGRGVCGAQESR